jgi:hypothetical protein
VFCLFCAPIVSFRDDLRPFMTLSSEQPEFWPGIPPEIRDPLRRREAQVSALADHEKDAPSVDRLCPRFHHRAERRSSDRRIQTGAGCEKIFTRTAAGTRSEGLGSIGRSPTCGRATR